MPQATAATNRDHGRRNVGAGGSFLLSFGIWWLAFAGLQIWVIAQAGFPYGIAVWDGLLSIAVLAGACSLVVNNMKYYLPQRERYVYVLVVSAALAGISLLLSKWGLSWIFSGDENYLGFLKNTLAMRFGLDFLVTGCMTMISLLWYTQKERSAAAVRQLDMQQWAREAELMNLRQQLQPHFLFNSLNSINALIGTRPEEARNMVRKLSDFLRGTLKKDDQSTTLAEELEQLELYLDIEKVRFGHRLNTMISCAPEALSVFIPALVIQPVMENAIKFGLYDTTGEVTISLAATIDNSLLELTVTNPFDPETSVSGKGTGFGLQSVRRRLFLLFGRNDLLQTGANENLFITRIRIPLKSHA